MPPLLTQKAYLDDEQTGVQFMQTSCGGELLIEDLRNHAPEMVKGLRGLFASGVFRTPDPKRAHFYEVRNEALVYYVYIFPANGKVLLLATWPR